MIKRIYISDETYPEYIDGKLAKLNTLLNDGYTVISAVGSHNEDGYMCEHITLWKPDQPTVKPTDVTNNHDDKEPQISPIVTDNLLIGGSALESFKAMIRRNDFVILDTETTGLHDGEIVQIAIINSAGQTLMNTYVKPLKTTLSDFNIAHGITSGKIADAPTWEHVLPDVQRLLDGENVVIYNAKYDRKMMHQSTEKSDLPKVEWKELAVFWCAMEAFAEEYGDWNEWHHSYRWQKLAKAARYYNIVIENEHDALADCLMTLDVVKAMAK